MRRARLLGILAVIGALGSPAEARAHALDLTTAKVEVRDRHAEIVVDVDLAQLVARIEPTAGDAATLASADDARLESHVASVRRVLEEGARLDADGVAIPLALRRAPSAAELRRAAREAATPGGHPTAQLRLEATRPLPDARSVTVSLPDALGRVLYTYSQPTTRLGEAGGGASFPVLAPRAEAPAVAPTALATREGRAFDRGWLAFAAAALAIVALLAHVLPRARKALA